MTDLLIRDVPEQDVRALNRLAARLGLSRNDYLKRQIAQEVSRAEPVRRLTVDDLRRHAEVFSGLEDEELMRQAWS